jgi:ATP-binding cassette subfamily F protein 3
MTYRSGDMVLRTKQLRVGYPNVSLFAADDLELRRCDCAAIIGPNGSGKTTFLKTLLKQLEPLAGQIFFGAGLKVGYFAQVHDSLKPENSVLDELLRHKNLPIGQARNYLAQYLFRGDDVFKPVNALSGGERGRLALAILALDGANLLLLDEPTNHLDIPAQEVLQEVLEGFEGTILLVSHDRYLVDRLATQIWELRAGRLYVFKDSYQEFVAAREAKKEKQKTSSVQPSAKPVSNGTPMKQLTTLEAQISEMEAFLAKLEQDLAAASQAQFVDEIRRLGQEYTATQAQLDHLVAEWESLVAN